MDFLDVENIDMAKLLDISWSSHTDHLKKLFQEMLYSNELADVTLVCDDKKQFQVHKLVLSACSPVFKSIISENILPNQSIFLKGINSQEMKSILQFIYIGHTTVFQHRINNFLDAARSLEITEISQTTIGNLEDPKDDKLDDSGKNKTYIHDIVNKGKEELKTTLLNASTGVKQEKVVNQRKEAPVKVKKEPIVSEKVNEKCPVCGKIFRQLHVYKKHMNTAHVIPCSKCDFKADSQALFIEHIQTSH